MPFEISYLGQWKLEGTTLSNRAGVTMNGRWKITDAGYILNDATGKYLSINGNTDAGSVVDEEFFDHTHKSGQLWKRLPNVDSGFFNLKNHDSGLFLTMKTANKLTIGNV